jgi:hypothetical protein
MGMLTEKDFWFGAIAAIAAMWAYNRFVAKKG